MAAKEKKKKVQTNTVPDFAGELNETLWSIISFEKCIAKNLTYPEAEKKLIKFEAKKIAGLCIVSVEAAEKIGGKR